MTGSIHVLVIWLLVPCFLHVSPDSLSNVLVRVNNGIRENSANSGEEASNVTNNSDDDDDDDDSGQEEPGADDRDEDPGQGILLTDGVPDYEDMMKKGDQQASANHDEEDEEEATLLREENAFFKVVGMTQDGEGDEDSDSDDDNDDDDDDDDDSKPSQKEITLAENFMRKLDTNLSFYEGRERAVAGGGAWNNNMWAGPGLGRRKRFIIQRRSWLWDDGIIPYDFSAISASKAEEYRTKVFSFYEKNTCLRFVNYKKADNPNYLRFKVGKGCKSFVGNVGSKGQDIYCCYWKTCLHEMGHAIGFHHEQNNPIRGDYVRINFDSIKNDYTSAYHRKTLYNHRVFGYYDYASLMHYYMNTFSKSGPAMTLFDPEMVYLVNNKDMSAFYMLYEINTMYGCTDSCRLSCSDGGYMAWLAGQCRCKCPPGQTPQTGCATVERHSLWPGGQFTLLRPKSGCPSGFEAGWRTQWAAELGTRSSTVAVTSPYFTSGDVGSDVITQEFCTKSYTEHYGPVPEWGAGRYCILRSGGTCPQGFVEGSYTFDDRVAPSPAEMSGGRVPDGDFSDDTTLHFCCRRDGSAASAIELPTEVSFILYRRGGACHAVTGMEVQEQSFTIQSDVTAAQHGGGMYPDIDVADDGSVTVKSCHYTRASDKVACGGVIYLTERDPVQKIKFPVLPKGSNPALKCFWFVKGPAKSKIRLTFPKFDIARGDTRCQDTLTIRSYLPGTTGIPYCGDSFKRTVITRFNTLHLKLDKGKGTKTSFVAEVKLISESDRCYADSRGVTYRGKVNYVEDFTPCLHWDRVPNCQFRMFDPRYFQYNLEGNYCRNPDSGVAPWCYTNAERCKRAYCDVCHVSECRDLFSDCQARLDADPNYCQDNERARQGCFATCGRCDHYKQALGVKSVSCGVPKIPSDAEPVEALRTSYSVGEEVQLKCRTGSTVRTIRCTEGATWTHTTYVCGACETGWYFFDNDCYKPTELKGRMNLAKSECAKMNGASVTTDLGEQEHGLLVSLMQGARGSLPDFWLGLYDYVEGVFEWGTGDALNWTNWAPDQPAVSKDKKCVVVTRWGWVSKNCNNDYRTVCKYNTDERKLCADLMQDCETIIRRNPTFCTDEKLAMAAGSCARSCNLCSGMAVFSQQCLEEGASVNTRTPPGTVAVGQYTVYKCLRDHLHVSGDLIRACLPSGQLTGTPPICKYTSNLMKRSLTRGRALIVTVNDVEIIQRSHTGVKGTAYLARNPSMRIPASGVIRAWHYYSTANGAVAFQVWRKTSSSSKFKLIGQNVVKETRAADTKRTLEISERQRIAVNKGDIIGVYYNGKAPGGIPYDTCSTTEFPGNKWQTSTNTVRSWSDWVVNGKYAFTSLPGCFVFSLSAEVDTS